MFKKNSQRNSPISIWSVERFCCEQPAVWEINPTDNREYFQEHLYIVDFFGKFVEILDDKVIFHGSCTTKTAYTIKVLIHYIAFCIRYSNNMFLAYGQMFFFMTLKSISKFKCKIILRLSSEYDFFRLKFLSIALCLFFDITTICRHIFILYMWFVCGIFFCPVLVQSVGDSMLYYEI